MAAPIGLSPGDHDWDFGFSYQWAPLADSETHLTAEREVSYRHWSAGTQVQGFKAKVNAFFPMPHRGHFAAEVGIGRDGDFALDNGDMIFLASSDEQSEWAGGSTTSDGYIGCFKGGGPGDYGAPYDHVKYPLPINFNGFNGPSFGEKTVEDAWATFAGMADPSTSACSALCRGFRYYGKEWTTGCHCGNMYGAFGEFDSEDPGGRSPLGCGGERGKFCGSQWHDARFCAGLSAVFDQTPPMWVSLTANNEPGSSSKCWASVPNLVPNPHALVDTGGRSVSSQGAGYFAERYCPGWANYLSPNTCSESEPCGNVIFDGGGDMVSGAPPFPLLGVTSLHCKSVLKLPHTVRHWQLHGDFVDGKLHRRSGWRVPTGQPDVPH